MHWLASIWVVIIAFGVIMYVILDGFDLGIGILSIFFKDEHERDLMISTILPVWDGNGTWLVFGGAALYGAFPLAFSVILPAIYMPILIMVLSLLFRGVALEFRFKAIKSKVFWDMCFFSGSMVATISQGLILGTFVRGFSLIPEQTVLGYEQWINPFGIACAIALVFGYVLLGSNRLIGKTTGAIQQKTFAISAKTQYIIIFSVILVSLWSPFLDAAIRSRWFNPQHMFYLALLPFLAALFLFMHWRAIKKKHEYLPFWSLIGVFITCYIGFIISSYPYIVPRHITYIEAAANDTTLTVMMIGAAIMLPALLFYTYYSYRIFRGKVTDKLGY